MKSSKDCFNCKTRLNIAEHIFSYVKLTNLRHVILINVKEVKENQMISFFFFKRDAVYEDTCSQSNCSINTSN